MKGFNSASSRKLENLFFAMHDKKLIEQAKARETAAARRAALQEASGISNAVVLEELDSHGIGPSSITAFMLTPLLQVAWSDGGIEEEEHAVLVTIIEQQGIKKGTPAHDFLEKWLNKRPSRELFSAWKSYADELLKSLPRPASDALRSDTMNRARAVAEAAGGFWGFGEKISDAEKSVLDEIQRTLGIGT